MEKFFEVSTDPPLQKSKKRQKGGSVAKSWDIPTNLSDVKYRLLKRIVGILLVLAFCTADNERAFSAMNRIKTLEQS